MTIPSDLETPLDQPWTTCGPPHLHGVIHDLCGGSPHAGSQVVHPVTHCVPRHPYPRTYTFAPLSPLVSCASMPPHRTPGGHQLPTGRRAAECSDLKPSSGHLARHPTKGMTQLNRHPGSRRLLSDVSRDLLFESKVDHPIPHSTRSRRGDIGPHDHQVVHHWSRLVQP